MGTEQVSAGGDSRFPRDMIKLVRFFIFNSAFGPKEGEEHKKIIFYHTDNETEQKTKQVGLAEAVIRFASVFSDMPCESLHTQKTKSVFFEAEPGYYMVLAVSVPCVSRKKTGTTTTEYVYHPENVHDNILVTILKRGYEMFRFFTGGFSHLEPDEDHELFIQRVSTFFIRYVSNIHFDRSDVSDLFQAVHFLTLEASAFLQVQSFVHRVEDEFNCIETCAFFHKGFVAWSGLQQKETVLLYHYLYSTLLPSTLSRMSSSVQTLGPFNGHQGRYLTGPQNLRDTDVSLIVPKVFLPGSEQDSLREHHMIVYHALGATLCLMVPCEIELTIDFFKRLDAHLGPRLTHMSADLHNVFGRHFGSTPGLLGDSGVGSSLATSPGSSGYPLPGSGGSDGDDKFHFMYYNSFNNAMKSTLPASVRGPPDENQPFKDAGHVISDLEMDFTRIKRRSNAGANLLDNSISTASDISVKLSNDQWVVGKLDGQRQVYTVVQTKNANLIDVGEEVDKMMAVEFRNICLLDK